MGWGSGPFGVSNWGFRGASTLQLIDAVAIRENVVRLRFNTGVLFNGVLGAGDSSNPKRYTIKPIQGTIGLDGEPARKVFPVAATQAALEGTFGSAIDVTTDRAFTAFPSRYRVAVKGIHASNGALLEPSKTSFEFYGLRKERPKPRTDMVAASRDIANPQVGSALLDPLPNPFDPLLLGTFPIDESGDFAVDEGIDSYRKRVIRRCYTRKGAFPWMPDYGVGLPEQIKRLSRRGVRDAIAAEVESQIAKEPETIEVNAHFEQDHRSPELFWLRVRARTAFSSNPVEFGLPFSPTG